MNTVSDSLFEEQLRLLLRRGESTTLEFKKNVPSPKVLARELSAFANTDGGLIILDVDEDGQIIGVDPSGAKAAFDAAQSLVTTGCEFHSLSEGGR